MDDAWSRDAADAFERGAAVGDQRVDQRARQIAGRRMDDEARRLLDHDEIVILVDDLEGNVLATRLGIGRRRHLDDITVAVFDPVVGVFYRFFVVRNEPLTDQLLKARAAEERKCARQKPVETPAALAVADNSKMSGAVVRI